MIINPFAFEFYVIGWFMAILEGGHIVPPCTQATFKSPALLGLINLSQIREGLKKIKKNYGKFHIGSWPPPPETRPFFEHFL